MIRPQLVRHEVRNPSAPDVAQAVGVHDAIATPTTASGCQGLSSLRSSTPGECSSKGRFVAALPVRLLVSRSTPRCSYTRQGYRPGTPAGTPTAVDPLSARRGEVVKKSWDRLPACHFPRISDRLEAYPTQ